MQTLTSDQEQEFLLFQARVAGMSREQAIAELVQIYTKMVIDDAKYRAAIANAWGIPQKETNE